MSFQGHEIEHRRFQVLDHQCPPLTRDAPVVLNWIFFDPSHANKESRPIRVTRTLLDGIVADCRNLFATALLNEFAFQAEERTVEFFKVSGLP